MTRQWLAGLALALTLIIGAFSPGSSASAQQVLPFGVDQRQAVDFYAAPEGVENPPLILFIHGGGWRIGNRGYVQQKPAFFTGLGYAFASTGYRLVPDATVEEQAADIASAVSMLRQRAPELGFDGARIVLVGHSAGAHLAALVGTDPAYLGEDMETIAGVILLDGAGYDVVAEMGRRRGVIGDFLIGRMYRNAFGTDPERQRALSPVTYAGAPDAPDWLILYVASRSVSRAQSENLGALLVDAGARVAVEGIPDTTHGRLNRELGDPGNAATGIIEDYLARLFGR
jgi:acetyl esterase/lipase